MNLQLKITGALLFLAGTALLGLSLWQIYRPLCPGVMGLACLYFSAVAFKQVRK